MNKTKILAASVLAALGVAGCASVESISEPAQTPRKEKLYAVTASHQLISFNAGTPNTIASKKALTGMESGDEVVGIDYRVARGILYALTRSGRIYTINTSTGAMTQVGKDKLAVELTGNEFGFDFNPTVDRIRIVSDTGLNMRAHPDTGAAVDSDVNTPGLQLDGRLMFVDSVTMQGKSPFVMAAAYTYNKTNDKITTNYAIDGVNDLLLLQGSKEGETPAVSPNTGRIFVVGTLGVGESTRVSFDISDVNNAAYGAFTTRLGKESKMYAIDLATGKATFLGTIKAGEYVRGMAIEP